MQKLSDIDAVIVRYADHLSPEAISFKLEGALTPEQVMTRTNQLVQASDWLTTVQQDQLVTLKMRQIIAELEELPRSVRNAEVIINGLEKVGNRLDKRAEATEKDLSTLYAFQGTVILDGIATALTHMRGRLTGADKLSEEEWDSALESALRFAAMEVAKHEGETIEEPVTVQSRAVGAPRKAVA